jgi:hypothetical protein
MTNPFHNRRCRLRGQAMAEVLLVGPLIGFIILTAVYVGTYFYSYSVSQAAAYSNSIHYSFSGNPKLLSNPDTSSAMESQTYWNRTIQENQHEQSGGFGDACLIDKQLIKSSLLIHHPAGGLMDAIMDFISPSGSLITRSLSVAYRPIYGGADPRTGGGGCEFPHKVAADTEPQDIPFNPPQTIEAGPAIVGSE